jgi:5-methylcytosine-specific restriction endonuclease McrA
MINHKRLSIVSGYQASKQRLRIRQRDEYQCQMCRRGVSVGVVDHIIALVNGGNDDDTNLQLLCDPCHWSKTCIDMGYTIRSGVDESGIPKSSTHHWNI